MYRKRGSYNFKCKHTHTHTHTHSVITDTYEDIFGYGTSGQQSEFGEAGERRSERNSAEVGVIQK